MVLEGRIVRVLFFAAYGTGLDLVSHRSGYAGSAVQGVYTGREALIPLNRSQLAQLSGDRSGPTVTPLFGEIGENRRGFIWMKVRRAGLSWRESSAPILCSIQDQKSIALEVKVGKSTIHTRISLAQMSDTRAEAAQEMVEAGLQTGMEDTLGVS